MQRVETGEQAGHAGAQLRVVLRRDRRDLAKIERPDGAALRVEVEKKTATADSGRLRLHDTERQRNGDGSIGGVAAIFENAESDLCGEWR